MSHPAVTWPLNYCSTNIFTLTLWSVEKVQQFSAGINKAGSSPAPSGASHVEMIRTTLSLENNYCSEVGISPGIHIFWVSSTKRSVDSRDGDVVSAT